MFIALSVLHLVLAIFLILVVLLQSGKGADIGAAFGGGSSQTVFGGRGAATFLSKLTTAAALLFMTSSLVLAIYSGHRVTSSVITEERAKQAAPSPTAPASSPASPAPSADKPSPPRQAPPAAK